MKEINTAFNARGGRIEIEIDSNRTAIATRETVRKPWKIIDPWGSWSMHGTRGSVLCDMQKRAAIFQAVEKES